MDDTITTIYCLCDEFLKAIHHQDDAQVRLTTAEVMTVPLVATTFFGANLDKTRRFLHEYGYMPKMISKGRFNHAANRGAGRSPAEKLCHIGATAGADHEAGVGVRAGDGVSQTYNDETDHAEWLVRCTGCGFRQRNPRPDYCQRCGAPLR